MRKTLIYALTAATALTAAMPFSSYAAVNTYRVPVGNGMQIFGNAQQGSNCKLPGAGGQLPDFGAQLPNLGVQLPCPDGIQTPARPGQGNHAVQMPQLPGGGGHTVENSSFTAQVVSLVNEERAKAGLSPLMVNDRAAEAAAVRAGEIMTSFSHTRPSGKSFSTALTEAGVSFRSSGENIAYGQKSPKKVMEGWMGSAGHRANILNQDFTEIGTAHVTDASGTDYWVQLFFN